MVSLLSRTATGTYIKIDIKTLCIWTLVSQPSWMSCISPISQKEMKVPTTVSLSILAWISPILIYVVYFSWPFWIWDIIEFDSLCSSDQLYRQSYHFSHCMICLRSFFTCTRKRAYWTRRTQGLVTVWSIWRAHPIYWSTTLSPSPWWISTGSTYAIYLSTVTWAVRVSDVYININSHLGCKSKWLIYLSSINCYSHLGCKKECLPHDKPVYLYIKYSTQILVIFTCVNFALLQLQRICSFNNIWDNEIVS